MPGWMWLLAAAIVLAPFVLMIAFNDTDVADSRGRRLDQKWRVRNR